MSGGYLTEFELKTTKFKACKNENNYEKSKHNGKKQRWCKRSEAKLESEGIGLVELVLRDILSAVSQYAPYV